MFCPTCRGEFLGDLVVCPDCEVDLVPDLPPASEDRQAAGERPADTQRSLFKRLWAGELSLPVTYWGFGTVGGWLLAFFGEAIIRSAPATAAGTRRVLTYTVFVLFYLVFISVAIWRSAGRYRGPAVWAHLARITILLGLLLGIASLLTPP